jgi:hypothetical protein
MYSFWSAQETSGHREFASHQAICKRPTNVIQRERTAEIQTFAYLLMV